MEGSEALRSSTDESWPSAMFGVGSVAGGGRGSGRDRGWGAAPSGKVTGVRTLGGHPVLVEAATEAVRDWQFDAAKESTTGPVTVVFQ